MKNLIAQLRSLNVTRGRFALWLVGLVTVVGVAANEVHVYRVAAQLAEVVADTNKIHSTNHGGKFGANVDHSTTTIHGGHSLVVEGDSLGGFMSGADKTKLDGVETGAQAVTGAHIQSATSALSSAISVNGQNLQSIADPLVSTDAVNARTLYTAAHPAVDSACLANVAALTGLAVTCDGVAMSAAGGRALLTAQTTGSQNGPWVVASGAWTRPLDFPAGMHAYGAVINVMQGSTKSMTEWRVTTLGASDVVGTNSLTVAQFSSGGGGAVSSVNGQTGAVVLTPAQLAAYSGIDVYVASTGALPTYTAANGTLGVGGTLTANANGAFPTVDGYTLVANDPIKGLIYVRHGASAIDNGVYMLTTQGSGGAAWVLTRYTLLDQAAELPGSKLRVVTSGSEFQYTALATPVMGTTHIFYKEIGTRIGPQYGVRYQSDFGFVQSISVATGVNIPGTDLAGFAAAGGTLTTNVTNTATQRGVFNCTLGTSATQACGFQGAFTAAVTQPDGGDAITISQDMGWDWTWTVSPAALSDGTNTYAFDLGWSHTRNASQKLPADFAGFIYDQTSGVSTTHWLTALTAAGVSTGTVIDSGVTVTAGTFNRLRSRKDAGDNTIHFYIDGVEIGTGSSTNVSTTFLSMLAMVFRTVGTANANSMQFGSVRVDIDFPQGLAA